MVSLLTVMLAVLRASAGMIIFRDKRKVMQVHHMSSLTMLVGLAISAQSAWYKANHYRQAFFGAVRFSSCRGPRVTCTDGIPAAIVLTKRVCTELAEARRFERGTCSRSYGG